jgi:LemA protein
MAIPTSPPTTAKPRPRWLIPVAVVAGVFFLIVLPLIASYNGMVNKQQAVDQKFADLDATLQRRHDLIPQLVGAVKGVLGQEQKVFGDIAQARTHYAGATSDTDKVAAANQEGSAIARLLVIMENYPQLQSAQNVQDLQTQIEGTENRINQARQDYNAVATQYNTSIRRFPRSLLAGMFGFDKKALFSASTESRDVPTVDLGPTPSVPPPTAPPTTAKP